MVHHNNGRIIHARVWITFIIILRFSLTASILPATLGCGGGGSSFGSVKGILTDNFGAVIGFPEAVIYLDGLQTVAHPNPEGFFSINAPEGQYSLRAYFIDVDAGFKLQGQKSVTLKNGKITDAGMLKISNPHLNEGWSRYQAGNYEGARLSFLKYLDYVRSGQSVIGSASVYSALGWTLGNGLNKPSEAIEHFQRAVNSWNGNVDAWVGLAGASLATMRSEGGYKFNQAIQAVSNAINNPGEYSSDPTHDDISEADLRVFRAFVNFLNGNTAGAVAEANNVVDLIAATGSPGGKDTHAIILAFIK